jgi:hypothetical protein
MILPTGPLKIEELSNEGLVNDSNRQQAQEGLLNLHSSEGEEGSSSPEEQQQRRKKHRTIVTTPESSEEEGPSRIATLLNEASRAEAQEVAEKNASAPVMPLPIADDSQQPVNWIVRRSSSADAGQGQSTPPSDSWKFPPSATVPNLQQYSRMSGNLLLGSFSSLISKKLN